MSFFSFLFGGNSHLDNSIKVLDTTSFKNAVSGKKVQLIDVRTPAEFKSGHIKNARNIDIFSSGFTSEINKLDKDQSVYIYCRSGGRSRKATKMMAALGFTEIYDLRGGIMNYN